MWSLALAMQGQSWPHLQLLTQLSSPDLVFPWKVSRTYVFGYLWSRVTTLLIWWSAGTGFSREVVVVPFLERVGQNSEHPDVVEDVPDHCRGHWTRWPRIPSYCIITLGIFDIWPSLMVLVITSVIFLLNLIKQFSQVMCHARLGQPEPIRRCRMKPNLGLENETDIFLWLV